MLDRYKKDVFLLRIVGIWEENITALTETLVVIGTIVEDLTFILIQSIACICS